MRVAVAIAALWLAACQTDNQTGAQAQEASTASEFHADIGRICDVERLSGAAAEETTARSIIAADWLGRNIKTQRARDFLAEVATMKAADKAKALRAAAREAGLEACPTALAWERL